MSGNHNAKLLDSSQGTEGKGSLGKEIWDSWKARQEHVLKPGGRGLKFQPMSLHTVASCVIFADEDPSLLLRFCGCDRKHIAALRKTLAIWPFQKKLADTDPGFPSFETTD